MSLHLSLNALHTEIIERYNRMFEKEMDWFYFPTYHKCALTMTDELMIIPMDKPSNLNFSFWGNILNWGPVEDLTTAVQFQKIYQVESEHCLENHKYAHLLRNNRCLIIADGYFSPNFYDKDEPPKFFYQKNKHNFEGRSIFSMAGIYEQSVKVYNCAILTIEGESLVENGQEKSSRIPLVLDQSFEEDWLRKDLSDEGILNLMRHGRTKEMFTCHEVSTDIYCKDKDTNQPYIIEPFEENDTT